MYNYITGKLSVLDEGMAVVETGGIGYELSMGSQSLMQLGSVGETVKVFTYLNVREDGISLFGFATKNEKALFLKLISVTGIGPKMAVTLLGNNRMSDVLSAIALGDIAALSKMKGIGKKTAERIVLELKDKISADFEIKLPEMSIMPDITVDDDAVAALMSLGFSRAEASAAVIKAAAPNLTTEQIIMRALKG